MADLPLFDPYKALEEIRRSGAQTPKPLPQELPQLLPQESAGVIREQDHRVKATSAASAGSAGAPAQHAPPARTNKEEERKENSIKSYTYARGGGAGGGPGVSVGAGPAEVAEPAEDATSHCLKRIKPEIEVAEVLSDGLRKWRAGLARLDPARPPCPGYRADEWPRTLSRAHAFLDAFGTQAEALGWTAPRLFGAHPEIGIVRVDACGALALPIGGPVRAITATEISFGHLTHRELPGQTKGPPWWEFGR